MALERAQKAKEYTEAAKNVATVLGLLAAGYWAVFQFAELKAAARAEAELSRAQQEIEVAAASSERARQAWDLRRPALELSISEVTVKASDQGLCVLSTVSITNKGELDAAAKMGVAPFVAARVDFKEGSGQPSSSERYPVGAQAQTVVIRAGVTRQLPYAVIVPTVGVYELEFRMTASVKDHEKLKELLGIEAGANIEWKARRHVYID